MKRKKNKDFSVIGIGASAGGLEALKAFFSNVSDQSGMAYVVVVHLTPNQPSRMPELLQEGAQIPVLAACDGQLVEPDHVYVITPGKMMTISENKIHLSDIGDRGRLHPIDLFLKSLAKDQGDGSAAVILSGTGTDGSSGIKEIKAYEGLVLVQSAETAEYDGMPKSAINTGLADMVLPPDQMPQKLLDYFSHSQAPLSQESSFPIDAHNQPWLNRIFEILLSRTGHDFSAYKSKTILRRIDRRMRLNHIEGQGAYAAFLKENPSEADNLFRELLIGVTCFFRDPDSFDLIKNSILPGLLEKAEPGSTFRVWVPGCSTGEEIYSLAIILHECLDSVVKPVRLNLFGTDIDKSAVDKAREGIFPGSIASDVSPERLKRFFIKNGESYRVCEEIRSCIVFSVQDVLRDPPFSRLNLLCCRNLLIYLDSEAQKKLLPLFHYTLVPDGILVLGSSETMSGFDRLFSVIDKKWKIFRRKEVPNALRQITDFPSGIFSKKHKSNQLSFASAAQRANLGQLTQKAVLDLFSPTSVLIDDKGEILHVQGHTGKYLEHPCGSPTSNIIDMARQGLRIELSSALRAAKSSEKQQTRKRISVFQSEGDIQFIDLHVCPLKTPGELSGNFLVVFEDRDAIVLRPDEDGTGKDPFFLESSRIAMLEKELQIMRETHQQTVEDLESSNEELKSSNEELQSSNEELESFKEELQSLNEELQTTIEDLEASKEDLHTANVRLEAFWNVSAAEDKSLDIICNHALDQMVGMLESSLGFLGFLNADESVITIHPWSGEAKNKCLTINRPVCFPVTEAGICAEAIRRRDNLLINDCEAFHCTLKWLPGTDATLTNLIVTPIFQQDRISAIAAVANRPQPYGEQDLKQLSSFIGAVMVIIDRKRAEEELYQKNMMITNLMESISDAFFAMDNNLVVTFFNPAAERMLNRKSADIIGRYLFDAFPEARGSIFDEKYHEAVKEKIFLSFETYFDVAPYQNWYEVRVYPQDNGISVFFQVITDRKRAEDVLREKAIIAQTFMDALPCVALLLKSKTREIVALNRTAYEAGARIGSTCYGSWPKTDRPCFFCNAPDSWKTGEHKFKEVTALGVIWEAHWVPVTKDLYLHYALDITDRKQKEMELQRLNERLLLSQQAAGSGIWDWDMATGELNWSDELFHLFGLDPKESQASFDLWRKILHPQDRQRTEDRLNEAIRDRIRLQNEYRIILPTGEERWINALGDTTYDGQGNPKRMTGICIDVTDRKKAEADLLATEKQLREAMKMEAVGTLAGGIAHEFNNLLYVISGNTELLLEQARSEDIGCLSQIKETTARAADLVKQILAFSRRTEINLRPADLNTEIEKTAKMLSSLLPRMISIQLELAND